MVFLGPLYMPLIWGFAYKTSSNMYLASHILRCKILKKNDKRLATLLSILTVVDTSVYCPDCPLQDQCAHLPIYWGCCLWPLIARSLPKNIPQLKGAASLKVTLPPLGGWHPVICCYRVERPSLLASIWDNPSGSFQLHSSSVEAGVAASLQSSFSVFPGLLPSVPYR